LANNDAIGGKLLIGRRK